MGTCIRHMDSTIRTTPEKAYSATHDACKASGLALTLGEFDESTGQPDGLYFDGCTPYPDGDMSYDDVDAIADVCAAFDVGTSFTWFDEDDFSFQRVEKADGGVIVAKSWYPDADEIPFG